MKRTLTTVAALLAACTLTLSTSACSDDSGSTPDGKVDTGGHDGGGDTGGGDTGGGDGGGGSLTVPATATMTAGAGTSILSAFICMNPALGGGFAFSLESNSLSPCIGGQQYLIFTLDGTNYKVTAGNEATDAIGGSKPVNIKSTSEGTVTQNSASADQVENLPESTDVTISTASHSKVTFSFAGNDVTVKAFE